MNILDAQQQRIVQLNQLYEIRHDAIQQTALVQQQRKRWHDEFIRKEQFKPSDWDILFYSKFKNFKGKLSTHWLGPYDIEMIFEKGPVWINTIDKDQVSF
jgi:hypothetical protein